MKSVKSKVLHTVAGASLLERTFAVVSGVSSRKIIIVVNKKNKSEIEKTFKNQAAYALQAEPKGTGDATKQALKKVPKNIPVVCVMYGDDTAFYKPKTIQEVCKHHLNSKATATFVTVKLKDPAGFGRIVRKNGKVSAIVEEKDATAEEKKINEVNDGVYFFDRIWLSKNIQKLRPSPATGELYITDMIAAAIREKKKVETYTLPDESQWHSVNTPGDLASAQKRLGKNIHIMGIAGAGASAVAGIAKGFGYQVDGCDLISDSPYAENLEVPIYKNHAPSHLKQAEMLIVSPSVQKLDPENPEIDEARKLKIPTFTWQKFQGEFLQKGKFVIAISGTYGKSTTTAMISQILIDQNLDPTCEIGAKVLAWGANFKVGKSKYYVCEADEYNDNYLNYKPDIAVILNVGWDHPDYFKTQEEVILSYKKFVANIKKGGILVIGDDKKSRSLSKSARADIKVAKIARIDKLNLSIIGNFRNENANAALTFAKVLNLDMKKARSSVEKFSGLARRLEYKGNIANVRVYDDYAVQPFTALKTVEALKEKFPQKKLALVFEPHTFSRIKFFFKDFVKSLKDCKSDYIFITDIYAAREEGNTQNLARQLVDSVGSKAQYLGSLEKCAKYLKSHMSEFDVILLMGAGRSYKIWEMLAAN